MKLTADLAALALVLVSLSAVVLALYYPFARRRRSARSNDRRPTQGGRAWHVEAGDPLATLRSPYKTTPLCRRCLAVGHAGDTTYFMCRMNEQCELYEDERAT